MKVCTLKRFLKYSILISLTSFVTTVVYHLIRKSNHNFSSVVENDIFYESVNRVPRSEKTDWHDYQLIKEEELREGN